MAEEELMTELFYILEERHEPHPVFRLWERARCEAVNSDRLPVVFVSGPEWQGRLVVIHEADFAALSGECLDQAPRR
jgi:hypothetical protein